MNQKTAKMIACGAFAVLIVLGECWPAQAQDPKGPYASMAPLDQYLMADRNAEIALARSAAPAGDIKRCRGLGPRAERLRNRGQRQERFRMRRGARVDGPIRW
jgi:hypothetical protein